MNANKKGLSLDKKLPKTSSSPNNDPNLPPWYSYPKIFTP